jgi:UDP-3-O-acyl N-acetylglucosamine deacetylase
MPDKQHTVGGVAVVRGTAAFTAEFVTVEIHPAPVDHGPRFELLHEGRVFSIPVSTKNIIETENRTILAVPGGSAGASPSRPDDSRRQIGIVEHVLATLHGMGVDNALVKVDSMEIPLIDGSAAPYVAALDEVGIVEQDAPRREIVIDRPVFIDDVALLMALPCDTLRLTYYLDHPTDIVGKRLAQIDVTPESFRSRIGPARTFMKAEKVEDLLASGAVRNPDEHQALVVYSDHVSQPLRFADEFCYHKMLDILGDLYLTGRRLRAHVVGVRSGHYQNRKLARKIAEEYLK